MVTEDKSIGFPDDEPNVVIKESSFVEEAPTVAGGRAPWYRKRWPLLAIALAVVAAMAALLFSNGRTDQATSGDASVAQSAPGATMPDGKYKTIGDYIAESGITSIPVPRATDGGPGLPGAPVFALGLWPGSTVSCHSQYCADELRGLNSTAGGGPSLTTKIVAERPYGAVQWESSVDPNDPPTMVVTLNKLTGDVDSSKILEYAPGELKNLPNFESLGEGSSDLTGYEAVQVAGRYTLDGEVRSIAEKTVIIPESDATYVLRILVESLDGDSDTLARVTATVDQLTVIEP